MSKSINKVKEPPKPKTRTLADVSKFKKQIVYFLERNDDLPEDNYIGDGQFAVLLKPLSFSNLLKYKEMFEISIDADLSKVFFMSAQEQRIGQMETRIAELASKPKQSKAEKEELEKLNEDFDKIKEIYDFKNNVWTTPYGTEARTSSEILIQILAFILACGGRVVEEEEDRQYVTDPITIDDIYDVVDVSAFLTTTDDNGQPLFFEILEVAGLFSPELLRKSMTEEEKTDVNSGN